MGLFFGALYNYTWFTDWVKSTKLLATFESFLLKKCHKMSRFSWPSVLIFVWSHGPWHMFVTAYCTTLINRNTCETKVSGVNTRGRGSVYHVPCLLTVVQHAITYVCCGPSPFLYRSRSLAYVNYTRLLTVVRVKLGFLVWTQGSSVYHLWCLFTAVWYAITFVCCGPST